MAGCMFDGSVDVSKLCARCAKLCYVQSKEINVEDLNANHICAQDISSVEVNADQLHANHGCLGDVTINRLCVSELNAPNFKPCNVNRAFVGLSADFTYNLGSDIQFDLITDDPSSAISLVPTTHFTAPVSGYYSASAFLNLSGIAGVGVIVGVPVASPSFSVNGVKRELTYIPFLSFSGQQYSSLTGTLYLVAGDQVTVQLNVFVLDAASGQIPYVGTVILKGGALGSGAVSNFSIYLVTELCGTGTTPIQCVPCQPVIIACKPVLTEGCSPCDLSTM